MRDAEAMYVLQGVQQRHGHILHRKRRHWARDPDHAVVKVIMALLAPVTSSLIPFTTCGCPATIWRMSNSFRSSSFFSFSFTTFTATMLPSMLGPVRGLIGSRARADGLRLPPPVCLRKHGRRRGCKYLNQSGRSVSEIAELLLRELWLG